MTVGVTVSDTRKFPAILRNEAYNFIEIEKGELKESISQCDVLYIWNLAYEELLECLQGSGQLPQRIHIARQGKDEATSELAKIKNITLTYADGVFTESISEFVVASMYMLAKSLHTSAAISIWKKYSQKPIQGSNALILGEGSIGQAVALLLRQNGVNISMVGKTEMHHFAKNGTFQKTNDWLLDIDHIVCCLPLNDSTAGILNLQFFSLFKAAHFINISRGKIVNTLGLLQAIQKGYVTGAVLDAFEEEPLPADSPLWSDQRIVISAHQSYYSIDWEERLHQSFLKLIKTVY